MGTCCSAPAARDGEKTVHVMGLGGNESAGTHRTTPSAAAAAAAATDRGSVPRRPALRQLSSPSSGPHSLDGVGSEADEEWHDALSEVDLAEALEEWEEETLHGQDPAVASAIKVLRAHGHLLPPDLEAAADAQRAAEMAAAAPEAGARVHVSAAAGAAPGSKRVLTRSRSQDLRVALDRPAAREGLGRAADLAGRGRVLAAHAAVAGAAKEAGATLAELAALPAEALSGALPAGACLDVASLAADAQFVDEALLALEDHSGWMVSRNDDLKVFYRHQRGSTVHSLKFSAAFAHPLEHLLAIVHEFDLIVTWNKFSLASIMLAEPSIFESFLYGAQWMMRPFKPMQGLLHARGFDLADEHKCLLVQLQDCTPEELPAGHKPLPPEWPKRKTVNFLPGSCLTLRPLPATPDGTARTEGALLLHLDPHIPFIPAFLLNFVLGVLAPYVFKQMLRVLDSSFADAAGVYSQRIRDQPHLYGLVQQRLAEFAAELTPEKGAQLAADGEGSTGRRRPSRKGRPPSPT